MDCESKPAYLYINSGLSWSINVSGKIIDLNFKLLSKRFFSDKNWLTCEPKPPIEPSSIVKTTSWSVASCQIRLSSSGFANLASINVIFIPFFAKFSSAIKHSLSLAPKLISATLLPSLIILPLPICNFSSIDGNCTPIPFPLGNLKADC